MSPGPVARLKPYFKTRPRPRPPAKPGAQTAPPAAAATPAAVPTPAAAASTPATSAPAATAAPAQTGPPAPDRTALVRRREQLARQYSAIQADLGGLVYEMAIRDHFRLDVVVRHAARLQAVDAELSAVEQSLGIATSAPMSSCPSCGTPIQLGSSFCGRCGTALGRPAQGSSPINAQGGSG